ncbi:hypothetical protein [Streptomyces sp. NPDC001480]|uniref:hypothetical protein n=1 Tax=Streptomyces sp. NPDC001480 TaxID=3364577 RepID=UPI0036CD5AAB
MGTPRGERRGAAAGGAAGVVGVAGVVVVAWGTRWTTGGTADGELGVSGAFTGAGADALGWTDGVSGEAGSEEIGAPRPTRGVRRGALRWMAGVAPATG